jgi:hypothetical protein
MAVRAKTPLLGISLTLQLLCRMFRQMNLIEYPSFDIELYCKEIHKKPFDIHCTRYKRILPTRPKKTRMKKEDGVFYRHGIERQETLV